tara:strand:+ start:427 stop:663 length:237 start_codon:yes stop_codon:yes gene_type:complete
MDTLKLSKQEISLSLVIWDTVYTKIHKRCPRFEGFTDLEKEEVVGDAVNKIALTLTKTLETRLEEEIMIVKRLHFYDI